MVGEEEEVDRQILGGALLKFRTVILFPMKMGKMISAMELAQRTRSMIQTLWVSSHRITKLLGKVKTKKNRKSGQN